MTLTNAIFLLGPYKQGGEYNVDTAIATAETILQAPSYGFLKQIARVESGLGLHRNTFNDRADCGVWQFTSIALAATKDIDSHPGLSRQHHKIKEALDLDWHTVQCDDLKYPLMGALAARMYLMTIPEPIPFDIVDRAYYWKAHYNSVAGQGTIDSFLEANNANPKH